VFSGGWWLFRRSVENGGVWDFDILGSEVDILTVGTFLPVLFISHDAAPPCLHSSPHLPAPMALDGRLPRQDNDSRRISYYLFKRTLFLSCLPDVSTFRRVSSPHTFFTSAHAPLPGLRRTPRAAFGRCCARTRALKTTRAVTRLRV